MSTPTPNRFPGSYPLEMARDAVAEEMHSDTREADSLLHGVDLEQIRHESIVDLLRELVELQRRQISIWQSPPKAPRYEKWSIKAAVLTPISTRDTRYVNIFCPGAAGVTLLMEQQGVAAAIQLVPGWQPNLLYMTDQTMLSLMSGASDITFLFEFRDDARR